MEGKEEAIMLCGSRSVPSSAATVIDAVVGELLAGGRSLIVGCATGADEAALRSIMAAGAVDRVKVFAAFGPGGAGAWHGSARSSVSRFAAAGGRVVWWAGGAAGVPLSIRLAARTRAVVSASSGLVCFFNAPDSRGTRLAARLAAQRGLPVVAFPLGFRGSLLPHLGAGEWRRCSGSAAWSGAWRWVSIQAALF